MAAPLEGCARWGYVMGLGAQIDMREQGPVIRGHADTWTVEDGGRRDLRRSRGQHTVERQQGPFDREGRFSRAAQVRPQKTPRQGETAPWPPFVQIAHQDRRLARFAEHVLADGAQLRPTQGLHQGQMHADQAEILPFARKIGDDRTAMTAPGQIQQSDLIDGEVGAREHDGAQKPMAVGRPAMRAVGVQIAQPGGRLDRRDIQKAPMWRDLFIGLLQDQRVDLTHGHFTAQGGQRTVRVNASVNVATAADVPAQAGKVLIYAVQYLAFAGRIQASNKRHDSLIFEDIDRIGK